MDETKAPGNGTLAEQGKNMAQNIAEVFDISGQILEDASWRDSCRRGRPRGPIP